MWELPEGRRAVRPRLQTPECHAHGVRRQLSQLTNHDGTENYYKQKPGSSCPGFFHLHQKVFGQEEAGTDAGGAGILSMMNRA
jgi:hypothetical protein